MINIIKFSYATLILLLLILLVAIPLIIVTFDVKKNMKVVDDMFNEFIKFMSE